MNTPRCTDPRFRYIPDRGCWSACLTCRRLAWSHEQADPLADIRNAIAIWVDRVDPADYPPVMRPTPTDTGD